MAVTGRKFGWTNFINNQLRKSEIMKHIKKALVLGLLAAPNALAWTGVASEPTQIANNILMGSQLGKQVAMYSKQVEEYRTQLQQFDLQTIAGKVADLAGLQGTFNAMEGYEEAFSIEGAAEFIRSRQSVGEMEGIFGAANSGGSADSGSTGGGQGTSQYIERLSEATDRKIEVNKASSELNRARMESIERDTENVGKLQDANSSAEGAMEASQVGNQIDSEILGQLVKMRQESAMAAQIAAEAQAAALEQEALNKAAEKEHQRRMQESIDSLKATEKPGQPRRKY